MDNLNRCTVDRQPKRPKRVRNSEVWNLPPPLPVSHSPLLTSPSAVAPSLLLSSPHKVFCFMAPVQMTYVATVQRHQAAASARCMQQVNKLLIINNKTRKFCILNAPKAATNSILGSVLCVKKQAKYFSLHSRTNKKQNHSVTMQNIR